MFRPKYLKFLVCIFFFHFVYSKENIEIFEEIGNANELLDNAINHLLTEEEILNDIEPMDIPNITQSGFKTSHGKLWGLSHAARVGNATYGISHFDKDGNKKDSLYIRGEVSSHDIKFSMNYKLRVLFVTVEGILEGKMGEVAANGSAYINEEHKDLDSFKVTRFEHFEITKVTAFTSFSSFILKTVANTIASVKKKQIISTMEGAVRDYIQTTMREIEIN